MFIHILFLLIINIILGLSYSNHLIVVKSLKNWPRTRNSRAHYSGRTLGHSIQINSILNITMEHIYYYAKNSFS